MNESAEPQGLDKPDWMNAIERGEKPERVIRTPIPVRAESATEDGDGAVTLRMRASHESEDRYGTIVEQRGILLARFEQNPVIPWSHNYDELPVARSDRNVIEDGALVEDWRFTPKDVYPFGDTVGRLYKHGFLHASSIGFMPLEWERREHSHGHHSFGAYRFTASELWETSAVTVPGQPEALVVARDVHGIDLAPMAEWASRFLDNHAADDGVRGHIERLWKATAERGLLSLPSSPADSMRSEPSAAQPEPEARVVSSFQSRMPLAPRDRQWDADAAITRWRSESGSTTAPSGTYWRAFGWWDRENREDFGAYKFPIADVIGGRLHVVLSAVNNALARVEGSDIPAEDRAALRSLLRRYQQRFEDDGDGMRDAPEVRGERLAALLNRLIDGLVTDDRSRSDVIAAMAAAAGISTSTVNQILNGSINCPPLDRLEGFADVLGTSVSRLRSAAEGDGCIYERGADANTWRATSKEASEKFRIRLALTRADHSGKQKNDQTEQAEIVRLQF